MTIRSKDFKVYMNSLGKFGQATPNSYAYYLNKADRLLKEDGYNGLDEFLQDKGIEPLKVWLENLSSEREDRPANIGSALKIYINFNNNRDVYEPFEPIDTYSNSEPQVSVFNLERDMQAAVRRQLHQLEAGLVEADGGREQSVSTGEIDILARDEKGHYVVIELKAGLCPKGAIEQVLGYAYALKAERSEIEQVRSILIAGDFSERTLAAAQLIPNLTLKTYLFSLQFQDANF